MDGRLYFGEFQPELEWFIWPEMESFGGDEKWQWCSGDIGWIIGQQKIRIETEKEEEEEEKKKKQKTKKKQRKKKKKKQKKRKTFEEFDWFGLFVDELAATMRIKMPAMRIAQGKLICIFMNN